MKRFFDPIISAWGGVFTHKLRSFLTILGVVIGVSAVIALMSVGQGTTASILSRVESLGANVVTISPGFTNTGGVRGGFGSASTLTLEDAQAIVDQVPYLQAVAPSNQTSFQLVYGSQNLRASVIGVTPEYQQVNTLTVASGSFISSDNYQQAAKVAVIGTNVASTLFGSADPLGQVIRAGNYTLLVVGVLESKGTSFTSQDNAVLVPLTALSQMSGQNLTSTGGHSVRSITLTVTNIQDISTVEQDITNLLALRHNVTSGNPDFSISSTQDIINQLSQVSSYVTILLGAIAGISLLVGGIGVMNIMLVSVIERTREIGIRKALGARERDIWGQFVIEAVFLTFTGGVVGVGFGWGASILISRLVTTTVLSMNIVILAVSVAIGIGLFFGFYPAWQASRLNPIEALRHE